MGGTVQFSSFCLMSSDAKSILGTICRMILSRPDMRRALRRPLFLFFVFVLAGTEVQMMCMEASTKEQVSTTRQFVQ